MPGVGVIGGAASTSGNGVGGVRPADLDRRLGAQLVDRAVATSALAGIAALAWSAGLAPGTTVATTMAAAALLAALAAAGTCRWGATPGKALHGLRVVDATTGGRLSAASALRRQAIVALAGLPTLGAGAVVLASVPTTRSDRRGQHDRWCGSLVVEDLPSPVPTPVVSPPAPEWVNLTALRLLPAAVPAPATRVRPRTGWRLAVGPAEPARYVEVSGPLLLGRDPTPRPGEEARGVRLADPQVSRTHALVRPDGDGPPVLVDRGATNPTVLLRDGRSRWVPAGVPVRLASGDRLRLGGTELRVLSGR